MARPPISSQATSAAMSHADVWRPAASPAPWAAAPAADGQDEDRRAQPEDLGPPGIAELDPGPGLAQGQAKAEEDQQGRQAERVREPRRHDRGDDGPGPGQQLYREFTGRHRPI